MKSGLIKSMSMVNERPVTRFGIHCTICLQVKVAFCLIFGWVGVIFLVNSSIFHQLGLFSHIFRAYD